MNINSNCSKVKSYLVSCMDSCDSKRRNNVPVDELKVIISDSVLSDIKTQRQNAMMGIAIFNLYLQKFFTEMILWMLSSIGRCAIHYSDPTRWSFRGNKR